MKPLPLTFTSKGFEYTQLERTGNVAIYEQRDIGSKRAGPHVCYEVIVVQSHNGYTIAGNEYPPSEFYPKDSDWGKRAWTFSCALTKDALELARAKAREVAKELDKRAKGGRVEGV